MYLDVIVLEFKLQCSMLDSRARAEMECNDQHDYSAQRFFIFS